MYYSRLHGFVPRNPALPAREDFYNPTRKGYPRLRGEPVVPLIRGGYSGLGGGYISSDVAKKWEWDSFAVGLGAAAVTFMLGMLPSIIAQSGRKGSSDPRLDQSIIPALLPATGAGILAYLLRWQMNHCGVMAAAEPEAPAEIGAVEQQRLARVVIHKCPAGQEWSTNQGKCVDILI